MLARPGSTTPGTEAPASPEDSSRIAPLNLSTRGEPGPGGPQDFPELQDMPLNLSVRDPCNALVSHPVHSPPPKAEPEAPAQKVDPKEPEAHMEEAAPGAPTRKTLDSSEEQKQTAAVALCQLATYSPGNPRPGDGEPTAPQEDTPTSQEAAGDPRPRGQKRTSPREAGKAQQGSKKTKASGTARVFMLRKRTRVS